MYSLLQELPMEYLFHSLVLRDSRSGTELVVLIGFALR